MRTRNWMVAASVALATSAWLWAEQPEYTSAGELKRPANYREWIYLSSGLGMSYGGRSGPMFDNVFAEPAAYREFVKSGRWPDKAMFVLELRRAQKEGSINTDGQFQTDAIAIEVEVKDEKRFQGGWGFFAFDGNGATAAQLPLTRDCYTCHKNNTAVENTFVQFYPTLMPIARAKGTVKPGYRDDAKGR